MAPLLAVVDQFITEKVNQWKEELKLLVDVGKTQPHAAFAAFTHGYVHKFSYLCRTAPNAELSLQPLEDSMSPLDCADAQLDAKRAAQKLHHDCAKEAATSLRDTVTSSLQCAMDLTQEKGASSWLASLPLEDFGFSLHKGAFRDAIALQYGWQPSHSPSSCACGSNFSVEHALSCHKGGFPTIRHNKVRDLTCS